MDFVHIWIIFKKEIKDAFRDTKSVLTNIFLPLIMVTVICFIIGLIVNGAIGDIKNNMNIAVVMEEGNISEVASFLKDKVLLDDKLKINIKEYASEEEAKEALKNNEIICIVRYKGNFFENVKNNKKSKIELEYNSTKNSSQLRNYDNKK